MDFYVSYQEEQSGVSRESRWKSESIRWLSHSSKNRQRTSVVAIRKPLLCEAQVQLSDKDIAEFDAASQAETN